MEQVAVKALVLVCVREHVPAVARAAVILPLLALPELGVLLALADVLEVALAVQDALAALLPALVLVLVNAHRDVTMTVIALAPVHVLVIAMDVKELVQVVVTVIVLVDALEGAKELVIHLVVEIVAEHVLENAVVVAAMNVADVPEIVLVPAQEDAQELVLPDVSLLAILVALKIVEIIVNKHAIKLVTALVKVVLIKPQP